jgi:hypothetical protein
VKQKWWYAIGGAVLGTFFGARVIALVGRR